jgi:hypothetical protein
VLGADNLAVERFPSSDPENFVPVHSYLLVERGVSIIEALWLEDLSKDGVYEFAMLILHACACWTRRRRHARHPRAPAKPRVGTNYCAAASFSGSLTASKVANSIAQGSPFSFSTLRI